MKNKSVMKARILSYLKALDPKHSIVACALQAAANHDFNFENILDLCKREYQEHPEGMIHCIGEVPMSLILKY